MIATIAGGASLTIGEPVLLTGADINATAAAGACPRLPLRQEMYIDHAGNPPWIVVNAG